MSSKNLKNKTVWITGGKRIGQSVAEELASLGANIVVSYRSSKAEAEELIRRLAETKKHIADLSAVKYCLLIKGNNIKILQY